jgi:hypothetical protein
MNLQSSNDSPPLPKGEKNKSTIWNYVFVATAKACTFEPIKLSKPISKYMGNFLEQYEYSYH